MRQNVWSNCTSIGLNALDGRRHEDIWVGVSVAVGVCGKVVRFDIGCYQDALLIGRDPQLNVDSQELSIANKKSPSVGLKSRTNDLKGVFPCCYSVEGKLTFAVCVSLLSVLVLGVRKSDPRMRDFVSLRVNDVPLNAGSLCESRVRANKTACEINHAQGQCRTASCTVNTHKKKRRVGRPISRLPACIVSTFVLFTQAIADKILTRVARHQWPGQPMADSREDQGAQRNGC